MTVTRKRPGSPSLPRRRAPRGAWPAFEKKLAETLEALEEDQYLVVSAKRGWAYVQFAAQGSFGLRAECVGNNYLDEAHALRAGQMALLRKIGWSSPTGTPEQASPKLQPLGSPNFFRDFDRPVPCADAARMAVRALTEVFEIPHPGYLMYKAFDKKQRMILIPTLGLMREEPAPPADRGERSHAEAKPRKKKRNDRTPETKKRITLGEKWDIDSEQLSVERPTVRRVLEVRESSVRFCNWDGEREHHAHAICHRVPGAVVAVGDNVPLEALGGYIAHHWYRRVGDECLIAHGDGTLCDGEHSAVKN